MVHQFAVASKNSHYQNIESVFMANSPITICKTICTVDQNAKPTMQITASPAAKQQHLFLCFGQSSGSCAAYSL
jgi:hypothetical protein